MFRCSLLHAASLGALLTASSLSAEPARTALPIPEATFDGTISEFAQDSTPGSPHRVTAPAGAPNVLVFMSDDVGFSMASTFGGPVPTPNLDKLAGIGSRYNRFHTTGICSPSRAALLTGRNHHNAGVGYLGQSNYPGYTGRIPASTATIAQTLRLNGYNTAMFGKHHNAGDAGQTASFDYWPTGLGFEYFYGFVAGYADQFSPDLHRGTNREPTPVGKTDVLDKRLADDAINWLHNQKAANPDKPFFIYYAPGSAHVPLQAPAEAIDRFKGQFDQGWDRLREETYRRQLKQGVIPAGTKLTPRPADIPAWASLSAEQKQFYARTMEAGAGMLAYQDEQVGRVLNELERIGERDNTLILFVHGDNGGPAESGNIGAVSEMYRFKGEISETITPELLEKLGGEETRPAYPAGWAWAVNSPFPGTKQYASMLGGIRNSMVMSWPARARSSSGKVCAEFGHLVDIAPTVLDAAGLPAPESVYGVPQKPYDGVSLLSSLDNCRPDRPRTQYFEIAGKGGIYHDGWFASREDGRSAWEFAPSQSRDAIAWRLYDLRSDFSQSTDLAAHNPEKLRTMVSLWEEEAKRNNVYPLLHAFAFGRYTGPTPTAVTPVPKPLQFWGKNVSIPANRLPVSRPFSLTASLKQTSAEDSGVIVAVGSHFSGWSLFLDQGRPTFAYAVTPQTQDNWRITSDRQIQAGDSKVTLDFTPSAAGGPAEVALRDGAGNLLAQGTIPRTYPSHDAIESLDVGRDTGVPVIRYADKTGAFDGDISNVRISFEKR